MRRIILSRKGFDSSAGGCPSPILPDGRLCSLPIPDTESAVCFGDITFDGINLGDVVSGLNREAGWHRRRAHLDPDLRPDALPRLPGWRPMLGQSGSAQGHLRNEGVAVGDLFLFFGSFRPVEEARHGDWRFSPALPARQVIWGWLQIGEILKVDDIPTDAMPWARYHPHFAYSEDASNTLYIATERLCLDGLLARLPGAGSFRYLDERLVLTAPGSTLQTRWQLPGWFAPSTERPGLSFHRNPNRWTRAGDRCMLNSAYRGQEFVFDALGEQAPLDWIKSLLRTA
ncbi:hypothetical protein LF844_00025 [Metapseudomonas lalkuanensis]|uniref:Nmad3 family putative nucleotide modification protein n=1 Tax=Metapseudomonas lalkuanensis TaxID=2604832 RepID=UPI001CF40397|nr:hypothetical protein [Pseudomonas lalkuanensis]UCO98242.1 hypothetical protein LF844_00025 [Pseudomonas lalkuanensis]